MEQVFVIIAVVIFWIFKGVAGKQRRVPGQDPYDTEAARWAHRHLRCGSPEDPGVAAACDRSAAALGGEAEAWPAGYGVIPDPQAGAEAVPAAARTRVGRPATTTRPCGRPAAQGSVRRHRANAGSGASLEPDSCPTTQLRGEHAGVVAS